MVRIVVLLISSSSSVIVSGGLSITTPSLDHTKVGSGRPTISAGMSMALPTLTMIESLLKYFSHVTVGATRRKEKDRNGPIHKDLLFVVLAKISNVISFNRILIDLSCSNYYVIVL